MGKTVSRITMERALGEELVGLSPGVVLDVGSKKAPYRAKVPATEYLTLDLRPDVGADIVGDLHDVPRESESIDTAIATEVLEHCYEPARAVNELHRVLRPGGLCLLTTRFIHPFHPDPHDYFRFTHEGLEHLFRGFSTTTVRPLGNRLHAAWILLPRRPPAGWVVDGLAPLVARISVPRSVNPCGWLVRAVK
jgi:SAM-dependent methyltransferase